jgi:nucleoside-diphosphate-sugar epimerase
MDILKNLSKLSTSELIRRREEKNCRILLTGGTGFLGAHLAVQLLEEGNRLILPVRPDKDLSPQQRMDRLWDWFGLDSALRQQARVIEARIDRPGLGLDPATEAEILGSVDEIVHCASDTSFSARKREAVEAVNIGGLRNVLALAARGRCGFFHLVSTAYVAGRSTGPCPEELVSPAGFTNVYEETKCRAEWLARDACRDAGLPLSIYRPSIVYGHSETGRSLLFNALYYPVRTAVFLRNLFEADIRERGGRKAAEMGVRLEDDGWLHMPIRMEVGDGGGINLIPIDFFVRAFAAIREDALDGGVFHLVNPRLKKIEEVIAYARRLFRMRGIEARYDAKSGLQPRNALEVLFDSYLEAYRPYMTDARTFAMERAGAVLERRGVSFPDFDYQSFSRCMTYAVECGWGSRLFKK